MCIAIVQLENSVISKDRLQTCFDNNDDGCGMAYVKGDKVEIYKTLDFEKFYKEYKRCTKKYPESKFLIHFRIRTQGYVDVDNCHPFRINDKMAFIHNGTIPKMPKCNIKSDTAYFNLNVLQLLPDGWMYNAAIHHLIEQSIGWSKLAVLNSDNEVLIINEASGEWDEDGNWYSNKSYIPRPAAKVYVTTKTRDNYYAKGSYYDFGATKRSDEELTYWVGTQKRRTYQGILQGYDWDNKLWRPIDLTGAYKYPLASEESYPIIPWEEPKRESAAAIKIVCETCDKPEDREEAALCHYEHEADTFYMCRCCMDSLADYITLGTIVVVYDPKEERK